MFKNYINCKKVNEVQLHNKQRRVCCSLSLQLIIINIIGILNHEKELLTYNCLSIDFKLLLIYIKRSQFNLYVFPNLLQKTGLKYLLEINMTKYDRIKVLHNFGFKKVFFRRSILYFCYLVFFFSLKISLQ